MSIIESYLININGFGNLSFLYIFIVKTPLPQRIMLSNPCTDFELVLRPFQIVNAIILGFFLAEEIFHLKIDDLFLFLHNQALQLLPSILSMFENEQNQIILGHSQYYMQFLAMVFSMLWAVKDHCSFPEKVLLSLPCMTVLIIFSSQYHCFSVFHIKLCI